MPAESGPAARPRSARPPAHLLEDGRKLWRELTSVYTFRPDELLTVAAAAELADHAALLRAEWEREGRPMTSRGSTGQLVAHPLLSAAQESLVKRSRLLAGLKLPDENQAGDVVRATRSDAARAAAVGRWQMPAGA